VKDPSKLEAAFLAAVAEAGIPVPTTELKFAPPWMVGPTGRRRQWRFDFAWPDRMLAVETEGGVWSGGRHTRGGGYIGDCAKYNAATLLGWRVLRYTAATVADGTAVREIAQALGSVAQTRLG
jgi:hypothetical protein